MNTRSIYVTVGNKGQNDSWEEQWTGYYPTLTEEQALDVVDDVMHAYNTNLRQGEQPREAISFVLGPVVDCKEQEV